MAAPRTVRDLLEARLGCSITTVKNRSTAAVGVAAVEILRQDPSRVAATIVNLSANHVYLSPVGEPSATAGVLLNPNGGEVSLWWEEDGEMVAWAWKAIADGAASAVFVLESLIAPRG